MIEKVLSRPVVWAEAFDDPPDAVLYPAEAAVIEHAVDDRRREFATGRLCARRALAQLSIPPVPIPRASRGMPRWPVGVVGSITHCRGYRAAAVARSREVAAVGIDAEPNAPLPRVVLARVAGAREQGRLRELAGTGHGPCWDRLLFSAKEAVYKVWFPLAGRRLGYDDLTIDIDPVGGSFSGRLLVAGPMLGHHRLETFKGRWYAADGLLATATVAPVPTPPGADRRNPGES
jgi:4'-phosphopantetheinyl transferase EntD